MTYTTEDIRKEHDDLAAKVLAASTEHEVTRAEIAEVTAQIADAEARYKQACLDAVDGKRADPMVVQAQEVAFRHKLTGLEQLRVRQAMDIQTFSERMRELSRLIDAQLELEAEETLNATHENIANAMKDAEAKFLEAQRKFRVSLQNVRQFHARKTERENAESWHRKRNG